MAALGADPIELRRVATDMRESQEGILAASRRVGGGVRSSGWRGTDARGFMARWHTHETRLSATAALLADAARELDRHATEQEKASAGGAAMAATDAHPSGGDPAHPSELPVRTESIRADTNLAMALGIETGTVLTIERMADGSAVVWIRDSAGVNAETGVGGSIGLDDFGAEASAESGVSAEGTMAKGWIVDAHDVDSLLVDLAAERGSDLLGRGIDLLVGGPLQGTLWSFAGTGPGRRAADAMEDILGLGLGDPDFTELSLGVGADGGVGLTTGVPLAGAGVVAATSVGISRGPGGESLVISGRGSVESDVVSKQPDAAAESRVEIPLSGGDVDVTVTTRSVAGESYTLTQDTYTIPESEIGEVVDAATSGDVVSAAGEALELIGPFEEPVHSVTAEGYGTKSGIDGLGGDAKLGIKAEVDIGISRESVEYGPAAAPAALGKPAEGGAGGTW
ncbi:MAG: hypothetical protein ACR2OH_01830 [Microthrixaceae bacterium]